jgi:hypothetical protein
MEMAPRTRRANLRIIAWAQLGAAVVFAGLAMYIGLAGFPLFSIVLGLVALLGVIVGARLLLATRLPANP